MSWFDRIREFVEEDDAKADDVDTEFDNIAEALNSLFQGGRVLQASLTGLEAALVDIPGASTTITVGVPSLLFTWESFYFETTGGLALLSGVLAVDGSAQTQKAEGHVNGVATITQSHCTKLATGAHTVKLRASISGPGGYCKKENTGFTYLVVPDPEP